MLTIKEIADIYNVTEEYIIHNIRMNSLEKYVTNFWLYEEDNIPRLSSTGFESHIELEGCLMLKDNLFTQCKKPIKDDLLSEERLRRMEKKAYEHAVKTLKMELVKKDKMLKEQEDSFQMSMCEDFSQLEEACTKIQQYISNCKKLV